MIRFLKIATTKKVLVILSSIIILTFSFLLFRSISRLNDYQSYLNDLNRLNELNQAKIDTNQLMVNPFNLTLIMDHYRSSGSNCDTPSTGSVNSAFFFDIETNSVQLHRIHDLIDYAKEDIIQTIDKTDYRMHRSPEGLFQESLIYLCETSDVLSNAISLIRSTAKPEASFQDYEDYVSSLKEKNPFFALFNRYDKEVYEAAAIVLDRFHPDTTLYVNDLGWNTAASDLDAIEQIVFDSDIETIPIFDLGGLTQTNQAMIRLYDLNIPASVKRIETGAFPNDIFDILVLRLNTLNDLILEYQSISGIQEIDFDIPLFNRDDTIDFSDHVDIEVDQTGQVTYTFNALSQSIQQYGLNGFTIREDNGIVMIDFYANDFLIGFARNVHITTYYLSPDAKHPYHVGISNEATFMDVETPVRSGFVFNGWKLDDLVITEGDQLPNKKVDVYADWIETA